jgi:hypothetical protein
MGSSLVKAITVCSVFVCTIVSADLAQAQRPGDTGFYIGAGLGYGKANIKSDSPDFDSVSEESGVASFRVGWFLRENIAIGLESIHWRKTTTVENVSGDVTFTASSAGRSSCPGDSASPRRSNIRT